MKEKIRQEGKSRFHLEVKSFKLSAYQDFPLGREVRHNKEGVFL